MSTLEFFLLFFSYYVHTYQNKKIFIVHFKHEYTVSHLTNTNPGLFQSRNSVQFPTRSATHGECFVLHRVSSPAGSPPKDLSLTGH